MEYKWTLRRGGAKMVCPNCGQRRFVPYVAAADGKTLAGPEFGRCDREQNCGYNRYPNGKSTEGIEQKPQPPQKMIRFVPAAVCVDTSSPLFAWVSRMFGVANALVAWRSYKVGAQRGRTLFWQIAKDGSIRGGKTIPYKEDGHRDKSDARPANWLHACREWKPYYEGDALEQCFFGEHLLSERPDAPVAVVESEKTALCMSIVSKGFVWLASGGSQGLKSENKRKALRGRRVTLFPDNGQFWNWKATADVEGWQIDATLEQHPLFEGCDLLDMVESGALGNDLILTK